MKKNSIFRNPLIGLLLLLFLFACKLENQNPKDTFVEGKLPRFLEKLANDHWQTKRYEGRIHNLIKRNAKQDRILVAVIDNGVDLLHPEIINNINWKLNKKGEIVTGFDAVGKTSRANASFINPELFAFGAKEVVDGKIGGYLEAPLDYLKEIQLDFAELLKAELKKKNLSETFFAKFNGKNFSVFEAMHITSQVTESAQSFKAKYDEAKSEARLLGVDTSPEKVRELHKKHHSEMQSRWSGTSLSKLYSKDWGQKKFIGIVDYRNVMELEGGWEFYKALERIVKKVDSKHDLYTKVKEFERFSANTSKSPRQLELWDKEWKFRGNSTLNRALSFKIHGPRPKLGIQSLLYSMMINVVNMKYMTEKSISLPIQVSQKELTDYIEKTLEAGIEQKLELNKNPSDITERTQAEELKKSIVQMKRLLQYFRNRNALSVDYELTEKEQALLKKMTREAYFNKHPMLSSKSLKKSHGTHVSSIILNGNRDKILIEPIRPLTESMDISYTKAMEISKNIEAEIERFLRNPVILRGLPNKLRQYGYSVPDNETKEVLVKETMALMKKHIASEAKSSPLDFLFVEDIVESIRHAGESKALLANVSLGTEFNKGAEDSEQTDKSKQLYRFLGFEYFKFRISEAILKHAPGTTFFVAAGNSQMWVDGHSKSALPFDLTSNYFKTFETAKQVLPNHEQKNIIGVMSSSEFKMLSSFTNVAIHKGVPVVVGVGEDVLSAVRTTDQSYNSEILQSRMTYNNLSLTANMDRKKQKEMLKKFFGPTKAKRIFSYEPTDISQKDMFYSILFMNYFGHISSAIPTAFATELNQKYPLDRSRYNGTSMATPASLQAFIRWVSKKAESEGLNRSELYGKKGYARDDFLKHLKEWTKRMGEDVYLIPLNFVKDQRFYEPGKKELVFKKAIDSVLGKQKRNTRWTNSQAPASCSKVLGKGL